MSSQDYPGDIHKLRLSQHPSDLPLYNSVTETTTHTSPVFTYRPNTLYVRPPPRHQDSVSALALWQSLSLHPAACIEAKLNLLVLVQ